MKFDYKNYSVIICGDIHGEFKTLLYNLRRYRIEDSIIIMAGDVGLGFCKPSYYDQLYEYIKPKLESSNNIILAVRGNHDDPDYYNGSLRLNYPNLKSIPDYSIISTDNHDILCIGGAYSVDKEDRIKDDSKRIKVGSSRRSWWSNELPYIDVEVLSDEDYDVIVSHCSPSCSFPHIMNAADPDRRIMDEIKRLADGKVSKWFYGHYHDSCFEYLDGIEFNLLNIHELKELR